MAMMNEAVVMDSDDEARAIFAKARELMGDQELEFDLDLAYSESIVDMVVEALERGRDDLFSQARNRHRWERQDREAADRAAERQAEAERRAQERAAELAEEREERARLRREGAERAAAPRKQAQDELAADRLAADRGARCMVDHETCEYRRSRGRPRRGEEVFVGEEAELLARWPHLGQA